MLMLTLATLLAGLSVTNSSGLTYSNLYSSEYQNQYLIGNYAEFGLTSDTDDVGVEEIWANNEVFTFELRNTGNSDISDIREFITISFYYERPTEEYVVNIYSSYQFSFDFWYDFYFGDYHVYGEAPAYRDALNISFAVPTQYISNTYHMDFNITFIELNEAFYDSYNVGFSDGSAYGYQNGYTDGFYDADNMDATASVIFSGILSIALVPVNFFLGILNFEVFGINIGALVSGLLSIAIVFIVIRMILGGNNSDK